MSIKCTTTCDQCQADVSDSVYVSLAAYQDNNKEIPELKKVKHFCGRTCLEKWLSFPPHIEKESS